jgi:nucleoside phosphorylase
MFICAGESEQFDFAIPIGIGLIDVAINLTQLCLEKKPNVLYFVGTAGSYGKYDYFDIVEATISSNIENSFLENKSYTPLDNIVSMLDIMEIGSDLTLLQSLKIDMNQSTFVSRETIVNSSNYITIDKTIAQKYQSLKIDLENMEFYAVMKVAKTMNIPVIGIFIVTNYCDENAHKTFVSHHKEAMQKLTTYIKEKYYE